MAITYNATAGTATFTSAGAVPRRRLTLPGTPTDGDLLVCWLAWQCSTTCPTCTPPAGWTAFAVLASSSGDASGP